jgi:hypothetical protein
LKKLKQNSSQLEGKGSGIELATIPMSLHIAIPLSRGLHHAYTAKSSDAILDINTFLHLIASFMDPVNLLD